jgi:hypothetical protein
MVKCDILYYYNANIHKYFGDCIVYETYFVADINILQQVGKCWRLNNIELDVNINDEKYSKKTNLGSANGGANTLHALRGRQCHFVMRSRSTVWTD